MAAEIREVVAVSDCTCDSALSESAVVAAAVAGAVAGPLCAGFILAGAAMMHRYTLGRPGRLLLLWLAYAVAAIFSPALLAMFVAGLFDTSRSAPLSDGGTAPPSKP